MSNCESKRWDPHEVQDEIEVPRTSISLHTPLYRIDRVGLDDCMSWVDSGCFPARWIASTLAELIFIGGIGVEKMHTNFPLKSLSTTPIAAWWKYLLKDASTFHLKEFGGRRGGVLHHRGFSTAPLEFWAKEPNQARHDGLLKISWVE